MTRPPLDPTHIRGVAFDGYGTLFDYGMPHFRIDIARTLAEQAIEVDLDAFFETWQRSYRLADVWPPEDGDAAPPANPGALQPPPPATDPADEGAEPPTRRWPTERALNGPLPPWHSQWEIWRRQFLAAARAHDLDADPDAAADRFRDALSIAPAYPEAHHTLEVLAQRGYVLGLLSNADEDFLQSALSRARLRFSVIQTSESLRAYKPHRAVFLATARRLGLQPHEVLYVGDSPYADVTGARNAGMPVAWIRREETALPDHLQPPDITIASLAELTQVLEGAHHP
jgi:2-haloalkanoic acid dehalogenase type II